MREQGGLALLRLAGEEPSIYVVGEEVAICEPHRLRGRKLIFQADVDPDRLKRNQGWLPAYRMNPASARYILQVTDVQVMRLSELQPYQVAAAHYGESLEEFYVLWDKHNAKFGQGVATNPLVEWVALRLRTELISAPKKAEVVHA